MFVCRSCARKATSTLVRRLPAAENRLVAPSRAFATSPVQRPDLQDHWGELEAVAAKENAAGEPHGTKEAQKHKDFARLRRATKKELQLTTDPYHIAQNVAKKLEDKQFDKALLLVQAASKDKQVVVSWNHLIEHQFRNQKLHVAIRLFNDMKKRAQLPNAQTYTIIFKGCAESSHPKQAVGEAIKIYNAMLNSTRLKPNVIHLNAVLDVCARAQDLESMFVALRSASGIRSPNNMTYTIILNALRHQRSNQVQAHEDPEEVGPLVKASIETTIARAKLVWDEVINRWKKGDIIMDEELMCAMGRALLLGGSKETDSILEAVGEVLGITKLRDGQPGLIDPDGLKKPERLNEMEQPDAPGALEQLAASAKAKEPDRAEDFHSERPKRPDPEPEQEKPPSRKVPENTTSGAMINMTGNNTLSLVLRALAQAQRTKLAARYWDFMTHSYGIVPDRRNYRDYIDCLSTGAASGKAARALVSMPSNIPDGNLYRRGLLLCKFDAYNENSFENATAIFDAMVRKLRVPDARCMKLYLDVSVSNDRQFKDTSTHPNWKAGASAHGKQMFSALDRVWEPLRRATNDLSFSDSATSSTSPQEAWRRSHANREEVMDAARKFIATSDKILSQGLIPKGDEDLKVAVIRRKVMNEFVLRFMEKTLQLGRGGTRQSVRGMERQEDKDAFSAVR